MNREEYAFAYNINGTGMSGIITMTNPPKLVCYCDEENSKTILKALNPSLPPAEGAGKFRDVLNEIQALIESPCYPTTGELKAIWNQLSDAITTSEQQPTVEGAEEILASLIESLGEPDNSIHDHSYEIRPLTVNGKCEWWMFHNGVGSGEPLAQWLQNFATLHAQKLADKMVSERLREELIAYDRWMSSQKWGVRELLSPETTVNEYLKTREK